MWRENRRAAAGTLPNDPNDTRIGSDQYNTWRANYGATATGGSATAAVPEPAAWLLTCCVLVFLMVVLGGVTRLTGSGLSIAEWSLAGFAVFAGLALWMMLSKEKGERPLFR